MCLGHSRSARSGYRGLVREDSASRRRLTVPVIVATLALFAGACGSSGTLDAKALSHEADAVRSTAAEGALLARDSLAGKTTRIYTREHATDLADAASRTESMLAAATTEPALEPELQQLSQVAGQVTAALERLIGASPGEEGAIADQLQAAADASRQVGEGLG
jgi:hypothetical protein